MKFKFSLEKVLKHRQIQLDMVRKEYIEAVDFFNSEKKILEDMFEKKEASLKQRSELVGMSGQWQSTVQQINEFLIGQDVRIENQQIRLEKINQIVEMRRENLRVALSEVKMMEKLKEKKREEFVNEVNKTEMKELDEISTIRYIRQNREKNG